jgi:hypothetical protein
MATKTAPPRALTSKSDEVKKHVAAVHTSGDLSLLERKTVNVLLLNAYDALLKTHKLPLQHLCAMLGWDESNNVERLQDVLRKLASTPVEFNMMEDGKEVWRVMSMLSYGEIKGGMCTYRYDEFLAERLYDPEVYATINIGVQRRFDGGYALTLYENCVRYKRVGSTGWWDLGRFRKIIGATAPMYDEFKYLKRDVITKPVEEINKVSDIRLTPEFQKDGRKVSAVRFLITESPQQSLLKPEAMDEHVELRQSETFKRLQEHGIGERLAMAWILQDEDRARAVVEYVEAKDKKKQVKGSTAGYIRKLIEDGADVGSTAYEAKKTEVEQASADQAQREARDARLHGLRDDFQRLRVTEAIKALSQEDRAAHAQQFMAEAGGGNTTSWGSEKADFTNPVERVKFSTWLRQKLAPAFDEAEFAVWLQAKSPQTQLPGA